MNIKASGLQWEHIHDGYLERTKSNTHRYSGITGDVGCVGARDLDYLKTAQKTHV